MIGGVRRVVLGGLTVAVLAAFPASASERPAVDYFYLPGSDGASSGGHAALRLGAWVYDFQYEDGLVRLRREDSNHFQHVYRTLQNRDLVLTRVRVEPETFDRLRWTFDRRRLVEQRRIAIAGALRRDRELLEALYAERDVASAPDGIAVEAVGFFFADGSPVPAAVPEGPRTGPEVLHRLRDRITARHGPGWLVERWREVGEGLSALRPTFPELDPVGPDPLRYATLSPSFARRYHERVAGRFALALLRAPKGLRSASLGPDLGPEGLLAPVERARLADLSEALLASMVRLAASPRRDWARALLLGMARLAALETSLATGRLVRLDPFPRAAVSWRRVPMERFARRASLADSISAPPTATSRSAAARVRQDSRRSTRASSSRAGKAGSTPGRSTAASSWPAWRTKSPPPRSVVRFEWKPARSSGWN